jgi:CRISPR/Cas system CSM-associated protein Csm5 (group 7 of RAMP superfamily)
VDCRRGGIKKRDRIENQVAKIIEENDFLEDSQAKEDPENAEPYCRNLLIEPPSNITQDFLIHEFVVTSTMSAMPGPSLKGRGATLL